jgi:hypothetical protein
MKPTASQPITADLSGALAELRRLVLDQQAALAAVAADVRELRARQRPADPRAPGFAAEVFAFVRDDAWTAASLYVDSKVGGGFKVLGTIYAVCGECPSSAIPVRFGRWLAAHRDEIATADLWLEACGKPRGVRRWRVARRG